MNLSVCRTVLGGSFKFLELLKDFVPRPDSKWTMRVLVDITSDFITLLGMVSHVVSEDLKGSGVGSVVGLRKGTVGSLGR